MFSEREVFLEDFPISCSWRCFPLGCFGSVIPASVGSEAGQELT